MAHYYFCPFPRRDQVLNRDRSAVLYKIKEGGPWALVKPMAKKKRGVDASPNKGPGLLQTAGAGDTIYLNAHGITGDHKRVADGRGVHANTMSCHDVADALINAGLDPSAQIFVICVICLSGSGGALNPRTLDDVTGGRCFARTLSRYLGGQIRVGGFPAELNFKFGHMAAWLEDENGFGRYHELNLRWYSQGHRA